MDPKLIQHISEQVYKKFPEMIGKKPKIRKQKPNGSGPNHNSNSLTYLLIFRGAGQGPRGKTIPRLVRVVASSKGRILKISTSRG